jgi:queuine/archaeosine tRNA-ribosyltransferase
MSPAEMLELDFPVLLANTYHLHARPELQTAKALE